MLRLLTSKVVDDDCEDSIDSCGGVDTSLMSNNVGRKAIKTASSMSSSSTVSDSV